MEAVDRERRPERDREQEDREGPDVVEEARDEPVEPATVVAREQGEDERQGGADDRRPDPDLQGVEPAVQQADGDVAALRVGAEYVLPACVPQLRPDGNAPGL